MSNSASLLHDCVVTVGVAPLLYTGTVTTVALTALLATTPARRRAAREVLAILLRPRQDRR
ncbi:hypothetical protein [Streptomyces sp. NPDC005141]